jgi:hypothetical protein
VNLQYWKKQKEAKEKLIAQNEQEIAELKVPPVKLFFIGLLVILIRGEQ